MGRGWGICVASVALLECQFRIGPVKPPETGSPVDMGEMHARDLSSPPMSDLAAVGDLCLPSGADLLPVTGVLEVAAPDVIPDSVNLSQEGTFDWAHCGYMNVAGVDDRRAGGPGAITVGGMGGNVSVNSPYTPTFSWSNGAPTPSATTQAGIFVTGQGHGLTVSVPATTTARTLRLYLDVFNASAQLTGHLSDGSAPDYVGQTISANDPGTYSRFTIRFRSASPGQTLTIHWTITADRNGSIALLAATLF